MATSVQTIQTFGAFLKAEREARQWSQQAVADRVNVSQPTIAGYEAGTNPPSLRTFTALGELYQWDDRRRLQALDLWSRFHTERIDWAQTVGVTTFGEAYTLAKRYVHAGKPHDAIPFAHAAVQLAQTDEERGKAYVAEGAVAQPRGDTESAEFYYRKALKLISDPEEQGNTSGGAWTHGCSGCASAAQ